MRREINKAKESRQVPNSAENFEDQRDRRYVFSMYIKVKILRDISTYILTARYCFYDSFKIVKPHRGNTTRGKLTIYPRGFPRFLETEVRFRQSSQVRPFESQSRPPRCRVRGSVSVLDVTQNPAYSDPRIFGLSGCRASPAPPDSGRQVREFLDLWIPKSCRKCRLLNSQIFAPPRIYRSPNSWIQEFLDSQIPRLFNESDQLPPSYSSPPSPPTKPQDTRISFSFLLVSVCRISVLEILTSSI